MTAARGRGCEFREETLGMVLKIVREFGFADLGEGLVFHVHPVHEFVARIRQKWMRITLQLRHLEPMQRHLHVPAGEDTDVVSLQYRAYPSAQPGNVRDF